MAKLKWGKPKIEVALLKNGALPTGASWTELSNPKDGSTQLSVSAGNKQEATVEGGELFAMRKGANKYTLETELFASEGATKPIADVNGIVAGEYAVRITPEDEKLEGYLMERCSVSLEESFTATDGGLWKYIFEGLKPTTGTILKPYKKTP